MQIWITLQYIDGLSDIWAVGVHSTQKEAEDIAHHVCSSCCGPLLGKIDILGPFKQSDLYFRQQGHHGSSQPMEPPS